MAINMQHKRDLCRVGIIVLYFDCGYILLFYFEMIIHSQKCAKMVHRSPKNVYPVLYYAYIIYNYLNNINFTLV